MPGSGDQNGVLVAACGAFDHLRVAHDRAVELGDAEMIAAIERAIASLVRAMDMAME